MFSERFTMSAIVFIGIFSLFVTGEYDLVVFADATLIAASRYES
jgi:hypothetical protein